MQQQQQQNKIIEVARRHIGYQANKDPLPGSMFGRWAADKLNQPWLAGPSNKIWWCMCFASYCVYEAGYQLQGGPQFNTDTTIALNRQHIVSTQTPRPGDVVIFDWNKRTAPTDHVGILVEFNTVRQTVTCIEGNTSRTMVGSQSAGNGVWERTRPLSSVACFIRPVPQQTATQQQTATPQATATQQQQQQGGPEMVIVKVGETHWMTDGMSRRPMKNMGSLNAFTSAGVPVVTANEQFLEDVPEAFNPAVINARVKDVKDLLTDYPLMSDDLKNHSILRKILLGS